MEIGGFAKNAKRACAFTRTQTLLSLGGHGMANEYLKMYTRFL